MEAKTELDLPNVKVQGNSATETAGGLYIGPDCALNSHGDFAGGGIEVSGNRAAESAGGLRYY